MRKLKIKEVQCKMALVKSNLPASNYVINPYIGCMHGCVYCYARFVKRFTGHKEPWGEFVDVKVNIIEALRKQLNTPEKIKKYKGTVAFSSVCDPYMPIESKYKLTRGLLKELAKTKLDVVILTKSDLVLRDIDLFKQNKKIEVGFTINSLDEDFRKKVEPYSSSVKQRIAALKKLHKEGIGTFAMLGPLFPHFSDIEALFKTFKKVGVSMIFSEDLNTNGQNWTNTKKVIKKYYPEIWPEYHQIFETKEIDFYTNAKKDLIRCSKQYNLPCEIYFDWH